MALKIRLARWGAKKRPFYRIVVADARAPRDGRFVEKIGTFDPLKPSEDAARLTIDVEKAKDWISKGAQPTERVAKFLGYAGLAPMPTYREQPIQSAPKKKAQERAAKAAAAV